jgi:hypothetical protein
MIVSSNFRDSLIKAMQILSSNEETVLPGI